MNYRVDFKGIIYGYDSTDLRRVISVTGEIVLIKNFRDFDVAIYKDNNDKKRIIILG